MQHKQAQHFVIRLAFLLICCAPPLAAGLESVDGPPELSPELRLLTARQLEHAASPADVAAQLLAAEQQGELNRSDARAAQRHLDGYQRLSLYERADYLAAVLGSDWSRGRHNAFWLARAQSMFERGQMQDAERALRRLLQPMDPALGEQRQSLLGLVLMEQERFTDALAELENRQGFPRSSLYDHYNFGIALISQGRKAEGLAVLDELGQTAMANGPEERALLDRANLAVGWSWLAAQQGGTARAFFKRVSLEGPHSGMALLGLGWAELAADGQPQQAHFRRTLYCEDVRDPPVSVTLLLFSPYQFCRPGRKAATFKYRHRFAYVPGGVGAARFRQALRPWRVLDQRGAQDPAAQEAWLAIAYAHERLRDYRSAEAAYQSAVRRYEEEITRLRAFAAALRQPAADPLAILAQQGRADEFRELRGSRPFAQAQADLGSLQQTAQDLQTTRIRMDRLQTSGERQREPLQPLQERWQQQNQALGTARVAIHDELTRLCLDELARRLGRLDQYHSNAVLALALLYDRHGGKLQAPVR